MCPGTPRRSRTRHTAWAAPGSSGTGPRGHPEGAGPGLTRAFPLPRAGPGLTPHSPLPRSPAPRQGREGHSYVQG